MFRFKQKLRSGVENSRYYHLAFQELIQGSKSLMANKLRRRPDGSTRMHWRKQMLALLFRMSSTALLGQERRRQNVPAIDELACLRSPGRDTERQAYFRDQNTK